MNPIALLMLAVGLLMLIVAFKGKQDNLITAVTGKSYGSSTLS